MLTLENKYYRQKFNYIAGADEVGRGCLCGPLVVACCILPKDFNSELINDSKKLTRKERENAYSLIINNAVDYSIEIISSQDVDKYNVYQASKMGMVLAYKNLSVRPDLLFTDAMKIESLDVDVIDIIHGDSLSKNIAAASILAKVTRDRIMNFYDVLYPDYGFKTNKGYGTKKHLEAIKQYGLIKGFYRLTYSPCINIQQKLF